ncbi:E3 ubiquitin-protein ligase SIAH1B [Galendromus occidentalis]|uniref:E3 ubiquitin-protein ligase SIAH1B n=1 Tax=Galendromus occidentalis TaxID=34638 RepID=A0AAJ6QSF4_9ACAR|nr:E3 ubiquitin-protein ligase SIAH1B [Galendromus occidentalis]
MAQSSPREYYFEGTQDETLLCLGDELLADPDAKVERCVICYRIPLSPRFVSLDCHQHIVCPECGAKVTNCPMCRRSAQALFRNLEVRKANNNVKLLCPFHQFGCAEICGVEEWKIHIRECPFEGAAWKAYLKVGLGVAEDTVSSCFSFLVKNCRRMKLKTRLRIFSSHGSHMC